ncbi:3D-(3,5/4)-trihydroxycyclohexane-1,2-dione acylhydrolase (decyclizing), partial [Halomonas litopenaei]|nr:3D-(3,5/4)-trihydroxycyclohexane-1,2-dione acylhydrolase (decyclizing) [Halomonas litopenaei]
YADACEDLQAFAEAHGIPVAETQAGKSALAWDHPLNLGPIGVTGGEPANAVCAQADLVLGVGTRFQDFTTGSWTAFAHDAKLIGLNAARHDAAKHLSATVVGDAKLGLMALQEALASYRPPESWTQ